MPHFQDENDAPFALPAHQMQELKDHIEKSINSALQEVVDIARRHAQTPASPAGLVEFDDQHQPPAAS